MPRLLIKHWRRRSHYKPASNSADAENALVSLGKIAVQSQYDFSQ